ncbi:MAG: hypothetical protein WA746_27520 [Isosphaeraceae bacterium]
MASRAFWKSLEINFNGCILYDSPGLIQWAVNKLLIGRGKMNAIQSVVKNGRVEVDAPPGWPDGMPVRVELGLTGQAEYDDESPETPEEIEAWLRWYHSLEPIVMTPEEEAAWEADRKMQKEFDIANAAERDRRIEGIFE